MVTSAARCLRRTDTRNSPPAAQTSASPGPGCIAGVLRSILASGGAGNRVPASSRALPSRRRSGPTASPPSGECVRERPNLVFNVVVAIEIRPCREDPGEEECRIDGGQFALPGPPPGCHVEKVIVEAFVTGAVG